jgi:hypothetical protein
MGQALPYVARVGHRSSSFSARPHTPRPHSASPPHTCADRPASRGCSPRFAICSVARLKARAIPTAQGLGLIPQLLWVARFSPDRHFTPRTPRLTPSRSRTAPRTSPREHTWRLVHNPRLRQSAASISCRSQSDAHSEPPDAESYGPCLLAHGRGSVDVLCLSAHSPTPQALPRTHPMACPNPDPASLWHTGVLEAMLQPREMGTPGSGQPQRCGVHTPTVPHRVRPAHHPRARFQ